MMQNTHERKGEEKIGHKEDEAQPEIFLQKKIQFQLALAISNSAMKVNMSEVQNGTGGPSRAESQQEKEENVIPFR